MSKLAGAVGVVLALAAGLAPAAAPAAPRRQARRDEARIRALEARFAQAVTDRDLDGLMSVYASDVFVFDLIPPRQYVGRAAYRENWRGFFKAFVGPIQFQVVDLAVSVDGSTAYSHAIERVVGVDPKGGKTDFTLRLTDVYRKRAGAWSIVQEHLSAPIDLDTGKADLTSKP